MKHFCVKKEGAAKFTPVIANSEVEAIKAHKSMGDRTRLSRTVLGRIR